MEPVELFFLYFSNFLGGFALLLSIIDIILARRQRRSTEVPSLEIQATGLPPYTATNKKTTIIIKNNGTAVGYSPRLTMISSLMPNVESEIEVKEEQINPNEKIEVSVVISLPPGENELKFIARVCVSEKFRKDEDWFDFNQIFGIKI